MAETTNDSAQTLDQRRANHAWNAVQRAKQKQDQHERQDPKKFGGQVKKLPTRILAAGLGQALAFLKAKDYAPGLLAELSDWIKTRIPPRKGEPDDLLERIIQGNSDFLRRATDEVLAYLVWLNRFAEAEGLTEGEES
ncbi:MAG: type III-B CRISPR module-associated protein Cmr5 [Gemmataceae bacterium]|jgi:CRISPR-associated protein Cmr5|uniref:CRISPR type III-B/RAMP module-associated protein Cmr5 n=1 Tax=Thermogemmata fonticola TaxID=2755323 RepID=A0A7V8VEP2_9BACT|nr:type III-B CRISPR module-associated protein Cmr5 [Thermogemmata fonticola]MBA2226670.1 type III-B CRISPR module-associated protein Cmr5 [Thermogemmata fonticola]MCX8139299.1 type III-B CRISPR module-associated protein Cmr5 [Gemmataceae bacterium]